MAKRVTILGSTGSIGKNTLDVIASAEAGTYKVAALSAHKNIALLAEQVIAFGVQHVAVSDTESIPKLRELLNGHDVNIYAGPDGLVELADVPTDFTMAAIIGAAGLAPTMKALEQGAHLGLANKEALVSAGPLFMRTAKRFGATILPVDSEHNAIFQVLETDNPRGVKRLILTASGGPFHSWDIDKMSAITRADALNHPVWSMGSKITIDSATMMNKGLELIEAHYLFNRPSAEIDIIIHPQSVVHSMVEYVDGSVLSQMGCPDMRTPIAYALGWPKRQAAPVASLDLTSTGALTFFEPDVIKFPALRLAREALEAGSAAQNILNAANEACVHAFLGDTIKYSDITAVVEATLEKLSSKFEFHKDAQSIEDIIAIDEQARRTASDIIQGLKFKAN